MSQGLDVYIVYEILKRLTTPFDEMKAFEAGIIDAKGKLLKSPRTNEEKNAYTPLDRLIVNIKRVMGKIPGGESKIATYAAAVYLLRESEDTSLTIEQHIINNIAMLEDNKQLYIKLQEDIANVASGIAGLDDNPPVNKRSKGRPRQIGRYINGIAYLKRKSRERLNERLNKQKNDSRSQQFSSEKFLKGKSSEFIEGFNEYIEGVDFSNAPYPRGSYKRMQWMQGWKAAMSNTYPPFVT